MGTLFEKWLFLDVTYSRCFVAYGGEIEAKSQDQVWSHFHRIFTGRRGFGLDKVSPVFNQIEGMNPWPVAHALLNGQR